ncbi:amidase [Tamaricihabitans halophyticus]|uniref:Amidase n=1 Tax=Tamaricihabitans halophyticus TaxID=1262583 RepID=A0A4V2SS25_9PSEU|nr:amidase [Tamaricihabitans halophyticus]TCP45126.1 amidase [Tamaricihabitans halophyticus]
MTVEPPSNADIAQLAASYGLALSEADLTSFRELITGSLTAFDEVARLYEQHRERAPERPHHWPAESENRYGAWYVRTDITERADGPLAGKQVAIKDNIAVAGVPMMNGSRAVEGYTPSTDATVVRRLLDAGATIAGKATCEDLCFSGGSHTSALGPVRNPWDSTRMTGGSSSGSAALVAAGEVDFAIGGDQGGSIRMPAAFCGIVGHKPTHGLVPYTGAFPIESTIDHLGPMTRTVAAAAETLQVIAGDDGYDPRQARLPDVQDYRAGLNAGLRGVRVGILQEGFGIPGLSEPEVDAAVLAATRVLADAGADVREITVPWHRDGLAVWSVLATEGATTQMVDGNGYGMNWAGRYDPEMIAHYAQGRIAHAEQLSETVKLTMLTGKYTKEKHGGRHYAMARELAWRLTSAYDAALAEVDVLVLPTVPYVAREFPGADASKAEYVTAGLGMIANTSPTDVTGHPAISVPAGQVAGLPTGMMIIGPRFDDASCLAVAAGYEAAVGGFPLPG